MNTDTRNEFLEEMGDFPINILAQYLTSEGWSGFNITELPGDEIQVKFFCNKGAANLFRAGVIGALTAYGDYEIINFYRANDLANDTAILTWTVKAN